MSNTDLKQCVCCSEWKPKDAYSRNKRTSDGLAIYCRVCNARKQREWKRAHPELADRYRGRVK